MNSAGIPDVLIGLGGGGSNIVYRFLKQEWILESVMGVDVEAGNDLNPLAAATIDSTSQRNLHSRRAGEVHERIQRVKDPAEKPGSGVLQFRQPTLLSESIPEQWFKEEGLENQADINELCQAEGLNNWWVSPESQAVQQVLETSFESGVVRNRSLGKAFYHLWKHENRLEKIDPSIQDSRVAVVTALGGGTGSGILLDYATDITSRDIHLYAVLPDPEAPSVEKANAFVALSELEYADQAGESPFRTITLLPHHSAAAESTFEMAAVRTLLAHQASITRAGTGMGTPPGQNRVLHEYTPFTIAAPDTIEVPLSEQAHALEFVQEFVDRRQEALKIEDERCSEVEAYLKECFPDTAGAVLDGAVLDADGSGYDSEVAVILRERVARDLLELLDVDVFAFTPFHSKIEHLQTSIESEIDLITGSTAPSGSDSDVEPQVFLEQVLTHLPATIPTIDGEQDHHPIYQELLDTIQTDLENIKRLHELSLAIAAITPDKTPHSPDQAKDIRQHLDAVLMGTDSADSFETIWEIQYHQDELATHVNEYREFRQELEAYYERAQELISQRLFRWQDGVSDELDRLASLNEIESDLREGIVRLQEEIEHAVQEIEAASSVSEVEDIILDLSQYQWVARAVNKHSITTLDLDRIEEVFNQEVREAKITWIEYNNSLINRVFGPNYENIYRTHWVSVEDSAWFSIQPPEAADDDPFTCRFNSDDLPQEREVDRYRNHLIDIIMRQFEADFLSLSLGDEIDQPVPGDGFEIFADEQVPAFLDNLKETLHKSTTQNVSALIGQLRPESPPEIDETEPTESSGPPMVNPYRLYFASLQEQYEDLRAEVREVEQLLDTLEFLPEPDRALTSAQKEYTTLIEEAQDEFVTGVNAGEGPYTTCFEFEPEGYQPSAELGDADFLTANTHRVADHFSNVLHRFGAGNDRVPICVSTPEVGPNYPNLSPSQYAHNVSTVALSRAFDQGTDLSEISNALDWGSRGICPLGNQTHQELFHMGGPDEITMVLFVSDVFLDNLSSMVVPDGYWDAYQQAQSDGYAVEHRHALGLGGRWDVWPTLGEWVSRKEPGSEETTKNEQNCSLSGGNGAFVYRDMIGDVDTSEFMGGLLTARQDTEETEQELFLNMLAFDQL